MGYRCTAALGCLVDTYSSNRLQLHEVSTCTYVLRLRLRLYKTATTDNMANDAYQNLCICSCRKLSTKLKCGVFGSGEGCFLVFKMLSRDVW